MFELEHLWSWKSGERIEVLEYLNQMQVDLWLSQETHNIKKRHCFHIHRVNSVSLMENITASASLHSPVWNNPDFTIDKKKKKSFFFIFWIIKGITHLCHVIQNKTFISFHNLIQNHVIDSSQFLEYFQLKSVILCKFKKTPINLTLPNPVQGLLNLSSSKKILSKIYISLCNSNTSIYVPVSKRYSFKYWILVRDVY